MEMNQQVWEGSSPLTRGKPATPESSVTSSGLIPAHAGKTSSTSPTSWQGWAHPRSRGENLLRIPASELVKGSSPLTRGKHLGVSHGGHVQGLIPAHAGKTSNSAVHTRRSRAHPRSRGENKPVTRVVTRPAGSSPLTRGKRPRANQRALRVRLIPAHAGKTTLWSD